MEPIRIYTDGACDPNPGIGGWGALLMFQGNEKEFYGGDPETTNNRMEMMGAISALEALQTPAAVIVYSDSKYLIDGITKWIKGWKKNGWKTRAGEVKNVDLWKRIDALAAKHSIRWEWVKGHNGNPGNERADTLARMGRMSVTGQVQKAGGFSNEAAWDSIKEAA